MRYLLFTLVALFLVACESSPPAPVIERAPQSNKPTPPIASKPSASPSVKSADASAPNAKDWRPDSYTVKKGDTLFGIGLEFGYDYKEIALANNIAPPYPIKIGQKLSFSSLNSKAASAEPKPTIENEDGVVVTPIKTEGAGTAAGTQVKPAESAVTPVLSEPRATREPYSLEALNRKPSDVKQSDVKPTETKSAETKPAEPKTAESKPVDDENISWAWPTQGKILSNFNEVSNKGIDIAGTAGQSINAASGGKVIYTGSDLRGYGKLVIVKHNKTYLSVYAHNSKILAKEGQNVVAGQKIAEMGNTDASAVKLHFEIRRQGKSVDPAKYLPQN
jgi:lipoprotein NlpD